MYEEQLSLDGGEEMSPIYPLHHLSFSTLFYKMAGCKYKLYKSKVSEDAVQQDPTFAMKKGKGGHRVIELGINLFRKHGKVPLDALALENLVNEEPLKQFSLEGIIDYIMVNKLSGLPEKTVEWKFDGIPMISILDYIGGDISNGKLFIDDWKFNTQIQQPIVLSPLQLGFYLISLLNADDESIRVEKFKFPIECHIVEFVQRISKQKLEIKSFPFVYHENTLKEIEDIIRNQIKYFIHFKDNNFWPKERSRSCSSCKMNDECNRFQL